MDKPIGSFIGLRTLKEDYKRIKDGFLIEVLHTHLLLFIDEDNRYYDNVVFKPKGVNREKYREAVKLVNKGSLLFLSYMTDYL